MEGPALEQPARIPRKRCLLKLLAKGGELRLEVGHLHAESRDFVAEGCEPIYLWRSG